MRSTIPPRSLPSDTIVVWSFFGVHFLKYRDSKTSLAMYVLAPYDYNRRCRQHAGARDQQSLSMIGDEAYDEMKTVYLRT